jgi:anti-repressor protein
MKRHLPVALFKEIKSTFAESSREEFKTTVNARAVHEWLGVKTPFHKWIQRRIDGYQFQEGVDYCVTVDKIVRGEEVNYHCVPDMVKQLAMVENSEKGKAARLYFLDCEQIAASNQEAIEKRDSLKVEFRPMTDAIKLDHAEPKPYHYTNELDMINRIVLGMTSKAYRAEHDIGTGDSIRDFMTVEQMKAVMELQRANTVLIKLGIAYDVRKAQLKELFDKWHCQALIDETMRIEA